MKTTAAQWRQHVEDWRGSGLSQAAYCRQHGLNGKSFSLWTRKPAAPGGGISLLPVVVGAGGTGKPEPVPVLSGTGGAGDVPVPGSAGLAGGRALPVNAPYAGDAPASVPEAVADGGLPPGPAAEIKAAPAPVTLRLHGAELALSTAVPPGWLAELLRCLA